MTGGSLFDPPLWQTVLLAVSPSVGMPVLLGTLAGLLVTAAKRAARGWRAARRAHPRKENGPCE